MKIVEKLKLKSFSPVPYLLTFFYMGTAIIFSLFNQSQSRLGQKWFVQKNVLFILLILIIIEIFFPSLFIYLIIPLLFCTAIFIHKDKNTHPLIGRLDYYNNQRWNAVVEAGKDWFKYGAIAGLIGIIIAVVQVQLLQGGQGGLFLIYNKCIELSADGSGTCLLTGDTIQIIGDRLAWLMNFYAAQGFLWVGLFFVIKKDLGKINKSFESSKEEIEEDLGEKIDKFRKEHYI